jgi:hypothetical protein
MSSTDMTRLALLRLRRKRAGNFNVPLLRKSPLLVTPRMVAAAMKKEGGFDLTFFDLSKVEFDTVDPMSLNQFKGVEAIWRVFPKGEFGNRQSDYVWGTVVVGLASSPKGIEVVAHIRVKT